MCLCVLTPHSAAAGAEPDAGDGERFANSLVERFQRDISESLLWSLHSNRPSFARLFMGQVCVSCSVTVVCYFLSVASCLLLTCCC